MNHMLGVIFAIASALVWGTGDFAGGLAARRINAFQVLALATSAGLGLLVALAIVVGETFPTLESVMWAIAAGLLGAVSLAAFYRGLALGRAAFVAPTAAVIGATIPVLFGTLLEGFPRLIQLSGMLVGVLGIWLVSRSYSDDRRVPNSGAFEAIVSGLGFGGFFVLIAQVEPGKVITPLIISKSASVIVSLGVLLGRRESVPPPRANPLAIIAGLFDAGGNGFFLLAKQLTRLDVAGVISSMFPAATVLLSRVVAKEAVGRMQWFGIILCLAAVALISM